jgi:fumarate hydratase, class I
LGFNYSETFKFGKDETEYRKLTDKHVSEFEVDGKKCLKVDPEGINLLAKAAFNDVSFFLRKKHLEKLGLILEDSEASDNDRFVATTLLKNSVVAAKGDLPTCQDTGTAIIMGKKGDGVFTGANDAEVISSAVYDVFQKRNLRYSQIAPMDMFQEKNTGDNLPAQIDLLSTPGNEYKFLFVSKGGGSANKTYLFQQTKSLLNEKNLTSFIEEKIRMLGTAACPPYHLAIVIGGTSAEINLKMVKLASCHYLDGLPTEGSAEGQAYRDLEWEEKVFKMTQKTKIGAQFGGKYFCHDVRVIRLSRHAASCPVGIGVSCSADRNIKGKINKDGVFVEQLEKNPGQFLPQEGLELEPAVDVDLNQPMDEIRKQLSKYPIKTRLNLSGTLIVARDAAHMRLAEMLDAGKLMPDYFKNHPVYYAGPAKTPKGMPSGSFGPTTANRMDPYVARFMAEGGNMIMLAKGNRSPDVAAACKKFGGFYLGSIGGPAAILAQDNIKNVEVVDFAELGMEAVRKIDVVNFPAFIVSDDKGNDFFEELT